jgi:hypothetical protein
MALLYPAAVPIAFTYNAWVESSIHYEHLIRPILAVTLICLVLTALLIALAGDRDLGALASFTITFAAVTSNQLAGLALCGFAGLLVVVARMSTVRDRATITRAASAVASIFLLVSVGTSLPVVTPIVWHDATADLGPAGPAASGPNMYAILLDGYPGAIAAQSLDPSWDRDRFPVALRSRGFQVVDGSRSNYVRTALTLASMFSMRHLTPADEARPSALRWMVDGGEALRKLHAGGYEITSVSSGFAPVDIHVADRRYVPSQLDELEVSLLRSTNAGTLVTRLFPDLPSAQQRTRVEAIFTAIEAEAERAGPARFVFAHVPAPHGPFVFHEDGSPRTEGLPTFYGDAPRLRGTTRQETIERCLEQATYIGDRAIAAIDRIVEADPEAVVVVFSDHGPGIDYEVSDPFGSGMNERTSNIMAVRSVDGAVTLADDATPINLLPAVFNAYLGESIARLPDETYAWADDDAMARFGGRPTLPSTD